MKSATFRVSGILVFLALLFSVAFSQPALAEEVSPVNCKGCVGNIESAISQSVKETGFEAQRKIDEAMNLLATRQISSHVPFEALNPQNSVVYHFSSREGLTSLATIPMHDGYSALSNFSIEFTSLNKIGNYNETVVEKNEVGNFVITNFINGMLNYKKTTDIAYISNQEIENVMKANSSLARMSIKTCASVVAGVGTALGGVIAAVCKGACVAAITGVAAPACLACIGMFVALSSSTAWKFIDCMKG